MSAGICETFHAAIVGPKQNKILSQRFNLQWLATEFIGLRQRIPKINVH
jgi:hypothetical protein